MRNRRGILIGTLAIIALAQPSVAGAIPRPAANPCSYSGKVNDYCGSAQAGSSGNRYTTFNAVRETESTRPEIGVAVKRTNNSFVYGAKGTSGSVIKTYPSTYGKAQCTKTSATGELIGCSYKS